RPGHRSIRAGKRRHMLTLEKGGDAMYGVFGGYTRWAVVFLIIFVLFFLLVPAWGGVAAGAAAAPGAVY
ncbi:MAG: hypothetical protein K6T31_09505, partial [Alicyclobacillus sp.]|nr:hypothetical protein [Alicyclobacillus sp.]